MAGATARKTKIFPTALHGPKPEPKVHQDDPGTLRTPFDQPPRSWTGGGGQNTLFPGMENLTSHRRDRSVTHRRKSPNVVLYKMSKSLERFPVFLNCA